MRPSLIVYGVVVENWRSMWRDAVASERKLPQCSTVFEGRKVMMRETVGGGGAAAAFLAWRRRRRVHILGVMVVDSRKRMLGKEQWVAIL